MIKNNTQYRVTKAAAKRFEAAIKELRSRRASANDTADPRLQKARRDAAQSQLDELREEIIEYESLRSGKVALVEEVLLSRIPRTLIRARIAAGMSQRELADKLGMKEQQIQRYEANDYQQASLARLGEIARALNV